MKVKMDEVDYWNKIALKFKHNHKNLCIDLYYYLINLYSSVVMRIIKNTKNAVITDLKILKTDLWEEYVSQHIGIGSVYRNIKKLNNEIFIVGIDLSSIVCSSSKKEVEYVVNGDIRSLPFADNSFDLILDLSTLDHISDDQVEAVLQEYRRCLRNRGLIVVIFDSYSNLIKKIINNEEYYFNFEKDFIVKKLKKLGFVIIFTGYLIWTWPVFNLLLKLRFLRHFVIRVIIKIEILLLPISFLFKAISRQCLIIAFINKY